MDVENGCTLTKFEGLKGVFDMCVLISVLDEIVFAGEIGLEG